MAEIGNFGTLIVFETNDKKILNFTDFSKSVEGRWEDHDVIMKKPKSEFLGPGLITIEFTITLNALHGIRPRSVLEELEKAVENGQVEYLVIGGKKVCSNKMRIDKLESSWDYVMDQGELLQATGNISMTEYV